MTRIEDVRLADELGADYIGLVFVPSSPRCVMLKQAGTLRAAARRAKIVGVFEGADADSLNSTAAALSLDYVQLHGDPDLDLCRRISVPVIQAFRGVPAADEAERFLGCCAYLLLDKAVGVPSVDLTAAAALPDSIRSRMFLAGGLTAENVRPAADWIEPFAVDCARGIESAPGVKDSTQMRLFMKNLRT